MLVAVGFAMSFVAAWIVVKSFLGYVHAPRLCVVRVVARDRWRVGLIALALGK